MVTTMTQEECDEADARALACYLQNECDLGESAWSYLLFLRDEKHLFSMASREPWWDRYKVVVTQLSKAFV